MTEYRCRGPSSGTRVGRCNCVLILDGTREQLRCPLCGWHGTVTEYYLSLGTPREIGAQEKGALDG